MALFSLANNTSYKSIMTALIILALLSLQGVGYSISQQCQDIPFDTGWHFHRGDIAGAELPDFDDSSWRVLDLPHDWTIEDLPAKENAVPQLEIVTGQWRFQKGDNSDWSDPGYDDSSWQLVNLPDNWESHSAHNAANVYGWFRRNIELPSDCVGVDFDLLLGCIDDVDETWVNGVRIGSTGSFPPDFVSQWSTERRYSVPASLIKGDGTDIIAVRVFDGSGDGGIYKVSSPDKRIGPFDPSESLSKHFTGNTVGGIGWYRKSFSIDQPGKHISIIFDGVYMNAEIWLNGKRVGHHPHGYTGFIFDLTEYVKAPGQDNVIAIKVRNEGRNSRWYSGSGIYRHVWLAVNEPVYMPAWGTFITTPVIGPDNAVVNTAIEAANMSDVTKYAQVKVDIKDHSGNIISSSAVNTLLKSDKTSIADIDLSVASPKLWSPDTPYLYTADIAVIVDGNILDSYSTEFGIRKIEVDAVNGFRLNGESLYLKGGCIHHDNGPLGSAAIDRAEYRKIELLKANGYNAIRSSHNPPSSTMLDACNRLGMMVIDESFDQWTRSKERNPQDYSKYFNDWHAHDIAAMVRRDRNHPSVIMWSIGNEIPEQFNAEDIQRKLRDEVLKHDPTRLITQAISTDWGNVEKNWSKLSDPAFKYLDIAGYNYLHQHYESDHSRHPDRIMLTTESFPKDTFKCWEMVRKHPYVIGDFVWTAMDYLGEAGLAHSILSNEPDSFFMPWPWFNAWCGDLDLCGFKKPQSYYRDIVWGRSKIELAVHAPIPQGLSEVISWWGWPNESLSWNWTGHEGQGLQVSVYSSCDTVQLMLNGELIGEKSISKEDEATARFTVPYMPGELTAIGIENGKKVAEKTIVTTGKPAALKLTADRNIINASPNDLAYITVEVVDASGIVVPDGRVEVSFSVAGSGILAGQASAVPNEPASFKQPVRVTYQGRCLAILQPDSKAGEIVLYAKAKGLESAKIVIKAVDYPVAISGK